MALTDTLERVAGQRIESIPSLNDAALKLRQATDEHEKRVKAVAAAEDAYGEAVAFGGDMKVETAYKALEDAKAKLQRRADMVEAAKAMHAAALRLKAERDEADRQGKMAAARARMGKAIEEAEKHIAALADVVQRVHEAQREILALAKPEEKDALKWQFDPLNNRLPRVIIDRLSFFPSFVYLRESALDWKDHRDGLLTWADGLKKR